MSATTVSRSWPASAAASMSSADRLARREQVVAVADAAAEVEHPPGAELRRGERVGGDVALPGRVEAARGRDDALAGDLHGLRRAPCADLGWDRVRAACGPVARRGRHRAHRARRRAAAGRSRGRACSPTSSRRAGIVAGRSLADVVSMVHTDAEITPPLSFVLAWLTTRIG